MSCPTPCASWVAIASTEPSSVPFWPENASNSAGSRGQKARGISGGGRGRRQMVHRSASIVAS